MPRKKQGLRSYHHKSRNGCMQCKRRRVKCTMQAPACANCVRRNEVCEYPTFSELGTLPQQPELFLDHRSGYPALAESSRQDSPRASHPTRASSSPQPIDQTTLPGDTSALLSLLFSKSWFSPQEKALWLPALSKLAAKYPYLHHSTLALTNLRQDPYSHQMGRTPAVAYQHQVEASSLFRQADPVVDDDNWLAVLAFGTCNLIFQFHTQNSCHEEDFDLIETLRVVRSTTSIQQAADPFFRRSELWKLILARTSIPDSQTDVGIRQALQELAHVISESATNDCNNGDAEAIAEINRQAFWELREWTHGCQDKPIRWDQYCQWPSAVSNEYLDLLDDGNDVALLIFIHWSAIMYRTCKRVVKSWVKRAAFYAVDRLQDAWGEQLVWPLEILTPSPGFDPCMPSVAPPLPVGTDSFDPNLLSIPTTMDFGMSSMSGYAYGGGMDFGQYMSTTSA